MLATTRCLPLVLLLSATACAVAPTDPDHDDNDDDVTGTVASADTRAHRPGDDFNADGRSDVLWVDDNGARLISTMRGTAAPIVSTIGTRPTAQWDVEGVADFTRDGVADILWRNTTTGAVSIWPMRNGQPTAFLSLPTASLDWEIRDTGDFDGDGSSDILWMNRNTRQVSIWFMNGTTVRQFAVVPLVPGPGWRIQSAADFNGDGKSDILWTQVNSNGQWTPSAWLMNGVNVIAHDAMVTPSWPWYIVDTADFDGDGKADILWQNGNSVSIWKMNGTQPSAFLSVNAQAPAGSGVADIGDYNGDGKADILWSTFTSSEPLRPASTTAWLMNGASIAASAALPPPTNSGCASGWRHRSGCFRIR